MEIVFVYQDNLEITPLQFIGQLYSAEATPYDDYAFLICFAMLKPMMFYVMFYNRTIGNGICSDGIGGRP